MKNKLMIKAGSLLLAGVMMTPLFVSADSQTCEGTARYYFSVEEVVEECGADGYGYDTYRTQADSKQGYCGDETTAENNYNALSNKLYTHATVFSSPKYYLKDPGTYTVHNIDKNKDKDKVEEWLDAVYETVDDPYKGKGAVVEKTDNNGNKLDIYLHGDWSVNTTGKPGSLNQMSSGTPVYETGIIRGLKDYDRDHSGSNLYDEFVDEVLASNFELELKDSSSAVSSSSSGVNIALSNNLSDATVYRKYTANILKTATPVDYAKWGLFYNYVSDERRGGSGNGCFINPVTDECFGESGDSEFADLNYEDNSAPDENIQNLYIDWSYSTDKEGSYQKYYIDNSYTNPKNIWNPGVSTWINNILYVDKTYTYDCSTGDKYIDEPEQNSPQTGIPSYGYLAIILAGAAGVYVIAKKRNKFIKF